MTFQVSALVQPDASVSFSFPPNPRRSLLYRLPSIPPQIPLRRRPRHRRTLTDHDRSDRRLVRRRQIRARIQRRRLLPLLHPVPSAAGAVVRRVVLGSRGLLFRDEELWKAVALVKPLISQLNVRKKEGPKRNLGGGREGRKNIRGGTQAASCPAAVAASRARGRG